MTIKLFVLNERVQYNHKVGDVSMRELNANEVDSVEGGNVLVVLAGAVLIYNAANILYEFGQGVVEGYNANIK